MTPSASRNWRAIIPRILAGLTAVFFLFAMGIYLSRQVDARLAGYVNEALGRIKARYGLQISVGSMEAGIGRLVLSEISVGDTNWLVIDRAEIAVSAIPWRDFLRPSSVVLDHVTTKLPWDRAKWPQDLLDVVKKYSRDSKNNDVAGGDSPRGMSPNFIKVSAARVEVADGHSKKILVENLSLFARLRERKMTLRARHVALGDDIEENFVEVEADVADESQVNLNIKHRRDFQGYPDWLLLCAVTRPTKAATCDVSAATIPEFIVKRGQRYFGNAFAPGYRGRVTFQRGRDESAKVFDVGIDGDLTNVSGEHSAIGVGVVGPSNFRIQAQMRVGLEPRILIAKGARIVLLTNADVPQEGIPLSFDANLVWPGGVRKPEGEISFAVTDLSCKQALAALPENFVPELATFKLGGTAELHGEVKLSASGADLKIKNSRFDCVVTQVPEMYTAAYLSTAFMIERETDRGKIMIPVDPLRPYFSSYKNIPHHVRAAFVSSEDSGFFQHHGVEMGAIVGAAERNAEAGRAAIGGSTITMQTVKNLFLARDKTISRKAQEMFLAWHIEREISKERILEIYLNMVEFGPGLYGVGRASQRFFGKEPSQLTLKEAVYLASLLPAPVPRYRYFCKGELTPNYERIVKQLLDRMLALGKISAVDHASALAETLLFATTERDESCGSGITKMTEDESPVHLEDERSNQH
jgi:hypothetical protein